MCDYCEHSKIFGRRSTHVDGGGKAVVFGSTYGPIVVGGIAAGAKMLSKHAALAKEQDLKDLYCYDRSLGHYWKLRRELTNDEWLEIDKRKKEGERLSDILDDMKVLE